MTRAAVLSDIHGNAIALRAVLSDIRKEGIKTIYCCGNIVGYYPQPKESISLVQKKNMIVTQGDYDFAVVTLNHMEQFTDEARSAIMRTYKLLWKREKKFLTELPMEHVDKQLTMVHGSPRGQVQTIDANAALREIVTVIKTRILLIGHTHLPFVSDIDGVFVVSPGSVGAPRDRDPRASYAIVNMETLTASIHRVHYNIDTAARKVREANLPSKLSERLYQAI